jgi:hypothetical protein
MVSEAGGERALRSPPWPVSAISLRHLPKCPKLSIASA